MNYLFRYPNNYVSKCYITIFLLRCIQTDMQRSRVKNLLGIVSVRLSYKWPLSEELSTVAAADSHSVCLSEAAVVVPAPRAGTGLSHVMCCPCCCAARPYGWSLHRLLGQGALAASLPPAPVGQGSPQIPAWSCAQAQQQTHSRGLKGTC